jgi:hypothetical protein
MSLFLDNVDKCFHHDTLILNACGIGFSCFHAMSVFFICEGTMALLLWRSHPTLLIIARVLELLAMNHEINHHSSSLGYKDSQHLEPYLTCYHTFTAWLMTQGKSVIKVSDPWS